MNILICYGTRPELIKLYPIINKFKGIIPYKLLYIKQHTNIIPNLDVYNDYIIDIEAKNNQSRLNNIISEILVKADPIIKKFTHVIVLGDTTTTLGVALCAYNNKIKIIHVEAGVRSNNLYSPYPEEGNRQLISRISNFNFCPTSDSLYNLTLENANGYSYVVGNTVIDNIVDIKPIYTNIVIVTLHRRDNESKFLDYFTTLEKIAEENKDLHFIFPMHPSPNVQKYKNIFSSINVCNPLDYKEFILLLSKAKIVITDSGGIIDESTFFGKKVIILRDDIESEKRIELGKRLFKVTNSEDLYATFNDLKNNYEISGSKSFGCGKAADKILKLILGEIYDSSNSNS